MGIRLKGQTTGYVEIKAPATAADNTLTLPNGNGSSNQVLTTDGSGGLTFAAPQLSTDTTPQLGGNLDVNGNDIVTTSNGDIDLDPNGSGQVVFKGNATRGSGAVKLNCENNSHGILVKGPPHSAGANYTLTLPNDTGTSGQLLSTNGSGVTSWTTVDASPSFQATASGAIADGKPCIIKSDGEVEQVTASTSNLSTLAVGTVGSYDGTGQIEQSRVVYHPARGVFVIYFKRYGQSYLYAQVAKPNGSGFTFGSAVTVYANSIQDFTMSICYDPDTERVVFVWGGGLQLRARVGQVNADDSITLGSDVVIDSANNGLTSDETTTTYDETIDKIVIGYRMTTAHVICATVTGGSTNSIAAFGNRKEMPSGVSNGDANSPACVCYSPAMAKTIVFYRDNDNGFKGAVGVLTITGSSGDIISVSARDYLASGIYPTAYSMVYDSNAQKHVVVFSDNSDSNSGRAVVVSDNGSGSAVFGTVLEYEPTGATRPEITFDSDSNRVIVLYRYVGSNNEAAIEPLTVSGTTLTAGTRVVFESETTSNQYVGIAYDNVNKVGIAVFSKDEGGSSPATNRYGQFTTVTVNSNLTTENFIGFSNGAYADNATATIQIVGSVDDAQSGLTPGQQYFVQLDGSLGLSAASTSVVAGTAVSATKLIVKG